MNRLYYKSCEIINQKSLLNRFYLFGINNIYNFSTPAITQKTPTQSDVIANETSSQSILEEKIIIPKKIHRSPTDILLALSATVGFDPTASHYKYHDDPFLQPKSNYDKRVFAMSQEAGRKAARWIRQQHSDLFMYKNADPPIKAFTPTINYDEKSIVDESSLQDLIDRAEVSDAILVYNLMNKRNIPIATETLQNLMELLCFFNHEDTLPDDLIEERWFQQSSMSSRQRQRKTWHDGQIAEQIFNQMNPKDERAYATMIRGMCKYYQIERGWSLYQEALEKNMINDIETFNAIIEIVGFLKESGDLRWQLLMEILKTINSCKIMPNVNTLNATLSIISSFGNYKHAIASTVRILAEFRNVLNIEPTLTTWYYILIIYCRDRGPTNGNVLYSILKEIEDKEFKIQNIKDTFFFVTAMNVCRNHLSNKDLAKRIDKLLHYGQNYNLIGDSYKESIYYRHYFGLLCTTEPFDVFMSETYNLLVPNIYIPEPGIMTEILNAVELNGTIEYLPKLWSDMIVFDHINRENLLNQILKIMVENRPNREIRVQADLDKNFVKIAMDIFNKYNQEDDNPNSDQAVPANKRNQQQQQQQLKLIFSGEMIGNILLLCCRGNDFEKANLVFNKIDKDQHNIVGIPNPDSLDEYIKLCITMKLPSRAIECLQYCCMNGLEKSKIFARNIISGFTLDENHLSKITTLIGPDALKDEETTL